MCVAESVKIRINVGDVLLPVAMFACSLDSYFRERAIFAVFLLSIYALLAIKPKINEKFRGVLLLAFAIFFVYTLLALYFPSVFLEIKTDEDNFVYKVVDRFSIFILIALVASLYDRNNMIRSVKFTALIHFIFFGIQFLCYYALDYQLDFVNLINDELSQRNWMGFGGDNVFRPSGLYFEPSNYAAYMSVYIAILIFMNVDVGRSKYLYPISMMLTLSTAGFIMGAISFFSLFVYKSKHSGVLNKTLVFPMIVLCVFLFSIPQLSRFSESSFATNANTSLRLKLVSAIRDSVISSPVKAIIGTGIYSYSKTIYDLENTDSGRAIASVQDSSMIVYFFMSFGVVGLFFVLWMLSMASGLAQKLAIFSVLLSKMSFLFPIFIFLVVTLVLSKFFNYRTAG